MKKIALIFTLIAGLTLNSKPAHADVKMACKIAAAAVGMALVCEGGSYAYKKCKSWYNFCKEKPWWPIAGLAVTVCCLHAGNELANKLTKTF